MFFVKSATVFILSILILLLIVSCTLYITMDQIQYISKGISYEELDQHINMRPRYNYEFEYLGTVYSIYVYPMVVGTIPITTSTPGYGGVPIYTTSHRPVTEEYFFIFNPGGLIFWGFLTEIRKEQDELLPALGSLVDEGLKDLKRQNYYDWRRHD